MTTTNRRGPVAALLFCSGLCALIYQTVWLREFRLIFGASTPASAAVLGVFMGGLGLGSAFLGRRTEASRKPLLYYGNLELLIALAAASTPALVWWSGNSMAQRVAPWCWATGWPPSSGSCSRRSS
jgi:hypothetical protein